MLILASTFSNSTHGKNLLEIANLYFSSEKQGTHPYRKDYVNKVRMIIDNTLFLENPTMYLHNSWKNLRTAELTDKENPNNIFLNNYFALVFIRQHLKPILDLLIAFDNHNEKLIQKYKFSLSLNTVD